MRNLLSNVLSTLSISTSILRPNSSAAAEATPAPQGAGDEESPEQPPEGNQSDHNNRSGGADETDEGHRDRIAVQTAALAALTFSVQLLVNLPMVVEPKLQFVYEANVAFLCITFFSASYTFLHVFCKEEEPAARRREKKLIVLIYVSIAITFALRVSLHVLFAVSSVRVLLITAVASLLGWLYLRRT